MPQDRPIVVGGGRQMVSINLPSSYQPLPETGKFSVIPADPKNLPFKSMVVKDGTKELFRWTLAGEWTITIE
jgi:hypothetical protein